MYDPPTSSDVNAGGFDDKSRAASISHTPSAPSDNVDHDDLAGLWSSGNAVHPSLSMPPALLCSLL